MCADEKEMRSVYAVALGSPVTFSTQYFHDKTYMHNNYMLDYTGNGALGWCGHQAKTGEWIQVYQQVPEYWTDVIVQGRGDYDDRVTKVKISHSMNGKTWKYVDDGKVFDANTDRKTKVRITFDTPVRARGIRINVEGFHNHPCLRFDAIFVQLN